MKVQIVFAHAMSKSHHAPFGNKNALPWKHNKEDLDFFKHVTSDGVLVMGSKTFKSLPCKLPNRPHIVLSRTNTATAKNGERADFYTSLPIKELIEHITDVYQDDFDKISFIGGPEVIYSALPFASCLYKSTIAERDRDVEYDVTIDLTAIFLKFPIRETIDTKECRNGSVLFIEKLTKGDL